MGKSRLNNDVCRHVVDSHEDHEDKISVDSPHASYFFRPKVVQITSGIISTSM